MFVHALHQNKGNASGLRTNVLAIPQHMFGCHASCGTWCNYNKDPENFQHRSLPSGKPLTDQSVKTQLSQLLQALADHADSIAPCGRTRDNESFNNIVAAKAPKAQHYSSSGSLKARVGAAVAQKNLGSTYLSKVYETCGLSPGSRFQSHATKTDKRKRQTNLYKTSVEYKRRRLDFSAYKTNAQSSQEVREGRTYESNVGLSSASADNYEIPAPVPVPSYHEIEESLFRKSTVVMFDLETTSLKKDCDIIQLAACCDDKYFTRYVTPNQSISRCSQKVTGITFMDGTMRHNGRVVNHMPIKQCLEEFLLWLSSHKPFVLAAHNSKAFDANRLARYVRKNGPYDLYSDFVPRFAETLPYFKTMYKLPNYKLSSVVSHVLGSDKDFAQHDAMEDSKMLQRLCKQSSEKSLRPSSFPIDAVLHCVLRQEACEANLSSMKPLIDNKLISLATATRVASSGLHLTDIQLAYKRKGADGVKHLLQEKDCNGCVRGTRSAAILKKLLLFFTN